MKLVIKVMWCKALTSFNFFQKLKIYTIVSIKSDNKTLKLTHLQKQQQKTPVDEEGGGNPEWHNTMTFDISRLESGFDDLLLVFEFRHQQLLGFKTVGEVQVPLRHLIEHAADENVKLVSYEVRNPEGKHNGVLDFSYQVITKDDYQINHRSHLGHHHHHHSKFIDRKHDAHADTATSTSSDKHISECHRTPLVQQSPFNPEKIAYPKIDLEDLSNIIPIWQSAAANITHYPNPMTAELQWASAPPTPSHFPPSPSPYVIYSSPQYGYPAYGDPHCGHYRPSEYNQH